MAGSRGSTLRPTRARPPPSPLDPTFLAESGGNPRRDAPLEVAAAVLADAGFLLGEGFDQGFEAVAAHLGAARLPGLKHPFIHIIYE